MRGEGKGLGWGKFGINQMQNRKRKKLKRKVLVYDTKYSQAVTHPSTNLAQCCLTSVIRRELVLSTWYGRRHKVTT